MIVIHGPLSQRLHGCNWRVSWWRSPNAPLPLARKDCATLGEVMQTIMLLMQEMERAETAREL